MPDMTEVLSRSCLGLDEPVRDALEQGRTVRSRNRDGEYAVVLTDDPVFREPVDHIRGIADQRADWTIVVPTFTLHNVAQAEADGDPHLSFWAPVLTRSGNRIGSMRVSASPYANTMTDQGMVQTRFVFLSTLRTGDLFRESVGDDAGRAILLRAVTDADDRGRLEAETVGGREQYVFDLGLDYLASKVVEGPRR